MTDRQMKFTLRSVERGSLRLAPIIYNILVNINHCWASLSEYTGI